MAIQLNTESSTMSRIVFNEPYESEGLEPQQIRDDFADLMLISDPEVMLRSLSSFLPTDTLAEFIDDHMMGRIWWTLTKLSPLNFTLTQNVLTPKICLMASKLGDETIITVPDVSEVLIDGLRDDELAEFFGIESEGLIYTNRGVLWTTELLQSCQDAYN